jgi:monoamine oxidase
MDRPVQGFPDNSYLTLIDDHAPVSFYLNPFGRPIVVVDLAGAYLADVAKAGSTALIELAAQAVGTALGTDARREIAKAATSQWTTDPDVRGAYSHALPGRASARQTIAQPVEDRIFIAGEAASTAAFASCHGAYESGVAAAKKALARSRSPVFPTRNGQ